MRFFFLNVFHLISFKSLLMNSIDILFLPYTNLNDTFLFLLISPYENEWDFI
jgi:hypothetical protein